MNKPCLCVQYSHTEAQSAVLFTDFDNDYLTLAGMPSKKCESSSNIPWNQGISEAKISIAFGPHGCTNV
jgi:hypothetical protein